MKLELMIVRRAFDAFVELDDAGTLWARLLWDGADVVVRATAVKRPRDGGPYVVERAFEVNIPAPAWVSDRGSAWMEAQRAALAPEAA